MLPSWQDKILALTLQLEGCQHVQLACIIGSSACVMHRRPDLVLLGLGWDGADERKMRSSFGMGKADFTSFIDLSCLVRSLGYFQTGLANMSQHILGFCIQKSKKVSGLLIWAALQCCTCMPTAPDNISICSLVAQCHL